VVTHQGREHRGTIAFSTLLPAEQFQLKISANPESSSQGGWAISVFALEPRTLRAVPGVSISGKVALARNGKAQTLEATGRTGPDGNTNLNFALPKLNGGYLVFQITGKLGNEVHHASQTLAGMDWSHQR
jgi:hypothetical protein